MGGWSVDLASRRSEWSDEVAAIHEMPAGTNPSVVALGTVEARQLRWPFFLVGYSLAYLLAAKLGIATSLDPEGIVILWPPNAIVLAALL